VNSFAHDNHVVKMSLCNSSRLFEKENPRQHGFQSDFLVETVIKMCHASEHRLLTVVVITTVAIPLTRACAGAASHVPATVVTT